MTIALNILGIIVVLGILYLMSPNKKDINKKMIIKAFIIQLVLAFILVKFPLGQMALQKVSDFVTKALSYGADGVSFVFGDVNKRKCICSIMYLANIIFVSALVGALYYLGVIGICS